MSKGWAPFFLTFRIHHPCSIWQKGRWLEPRIHRMFWNSAPQNCSTWKEAGEISAFVGLQLNSSQTEMRTDVHGMRWEKKPQRQCYSLIAISPPPAADFQGNNGHWYEVAVMPGEGRPSKGKEQSHQTTPRSCRATVQVRAGSVHTGGGSCITMNEITSWT